MSHSDLWGSGWWCGMATTDGSTSRLRQRWKIEPLSLQGFLWIKLPTRRRIGDDHQNLILQSLLNMTRIALSCYIWLPGIPPWYLKITAIVLVIGTFISIGDFFHRYKQHNTPILLLHDKSPMLWQQRTRQGPGNGESIFMKAKVKLRRRQNVSEESSGTWESEHEDWWGELKWVVNVEILKRKE